MNMNFMSMAPRVSWLMSMDIMSRHAGAADDQEVISHVSVGS